MNEQIISDINNFLKRFETSVKETDDHYDQLQRLGRYDPATPYGQKYHLIFLFGRLSKENPSYTRLYTKFLRVSRQLENLERKRGKEYRDILFSYLQNEINGYQGTIDFWGDPDDPDFVFESTNDLSHRDILEILIMELKKDHDLTEYEKRVSQMDDLFKKKILETLKRALEQCPFLEQPLMPDNFWWRHLSTILKEKQSVKR